jgi:hypothetical protein
VCRRKLRRSVFKSIPSLPNAVRALQERRSPGVAQCLEELSDFHHRLGILPLFKELFPTLFAKTIRRTGDVGMLQRLETFFPPFLEAINRQYFPVEDLDAEYAMDRFPIIPLPLLNYDVESEFEHEPVADRVAAYLVGCYNYAPSRAEVQDLLPNVALPACWSTEDHWCRTNASLFRKLCTHHPAPVRTFPLLLSTMAHDTGLVFFDASYDTGEWDHGYLWDKPTVLALQTQWKRARLIMKTNATTVRALDRCPSHWNTIFKCWAEMCRRTPKDVAHAA